MTGDPSDTATDSAASTAGRWSSSWRRRWLFRGVAAGLPLLVGLSVIAIVLIQRGALTIDLKSGEVEIHSGPIYLEEPGHERTGHRYLYDDRLGWRNIPNWQAHTHARNLTINSKGLRDREYTYEKPVGFKRILVLGDSYAWGYGVSNDEIFTERLEEKLTDDQPGWEVINTGVSGWGTDQQYLFLVDEGLKYAPDVVILAFFIVNDPINNTNVMQYGLSKPVFVNERLDLANVPVPKPGDHQPRITIRADPLNLTMAIIERINDVCLKNDCSLVVMKFGTFLDPHDPFMDSIDAEFLRRLNATDRLHLFDLDKAFSEGDVPAAEILSGNDDGHWNARGHALTAELLYQFLDTQSLIRAKNTIENGSH